MLEYKKTLAEKLGKDVVRTQIIALLNSIYGVFKIDLKMSNDIEIKEYQWPDLQQWNISFAIVGIGVSIDSKSCLNLARIAICPSITLQAISLF